MAFVEAKLRQQDGAARQLIVVVEEVNGLRVDHHKDVKIALVVGEAHLARILRAEVVATRLERVPEQTVALRAPEEGTRRGHAAVNPDVAVFNGDGFAAMAETTVLHAASVEILAAAARELQRCLVFFNRGNIERVNHRLARLLIYDAQQAAGGYLQAHGTGLYGIVAAIAGNAEGAGMRTRKVNKDLRGRIGLGRTKQAASIILKQAHDALAVEVGGETRAVGEKDFDGRRVELSHLLHPTRNAGRDR